MTCPRSLKLLDNQIIACRTCPRLVAWREKIGQEKRRAYLGQTYWAKPLPGFGDPLARVLVVGLAPGAHGGNRTGRMFTGDASGDFLFSALHRAGFANQPEAKALNDGLMLNDVYITAVCRCVPPDNKPLPAEISNCHPYLQYEFELLEKVEGVVVLGRIAFDTVSKLLYHQRKLATSAIFGHGVLQPSTDGAPWLLCSYHPSRHNTQTGRLTTTMFDQIWEQVNRLLGKDELLSCQEPGSS